MPATNIPLIDIQIKLNWETIANDLSKVVDLFSVFFQSIYLYKTNIINWNETAIPD